MAKGQVAIEFFLYAGVFLFVLLAAFSIITLMQNSEIPLREAIVAREQGETIAEALRLSSIAGPGFSYDMSIPQKLLGRPYEVVFDLENSLFVLTWQSSGGEVNYLYALPGYAYDLQGCLADGVLQSDDCGSVVHLYNDGEKLLVRQD